MRDFYNLDNYHYGKSSKKAYNRGKSFGYQILGFGSGVAGGPSFLPYQRGGFYFGAVNTTNLVSTSGVISADVTQVGTARTAPGGCGFGFDKGIIAKGYTGVEPANYTAISNLVSNVGVMATDTTGIDPVIGQCGAAQIGGDKGINCFGQNNGGKVNTKNLISNTGVVAAVAAGGGSAMSYIGCTSYSAENDKAIICFGDGSDLNQSNLISNTGVIAADGTGVGTAKFSPAAQTYGGDKAICAYGGAGTSLDAPSNLISNLGVVAADVSKVGTGR